MIRSWTVSGDPEEDEITSKFDIGDYVTVSDVLSFFYKRRGRVVSYYHEEDMTCFFTLDFVGTNIPLIAFHECKLDLAEPELFD